MFIQSTSNKFSAFLSIRSRPTENNLFRLLRSLRGTEALVNGKFLCCFFLMPGSFQRRSQRVVDLRISRHEALRRAQRRNSLFIFLDSNETKAPAQIGFGEIGIEF